MVFFNIKKWLVYKNLRAHTFCQNWLARKKWFCRSKWKGPGRSVQLLTRSLRGIHARADVNNMTDLVRNFLTFGQHFFDTFSRRKRRIWKRNLYFFGHLYLFATQSCENSRLPLTDGSLLSLRWFQEPSMDDIYDNWTTYLLASPKRAQTFGVPHIKKRKQTGMTVWALGYEETCRQVSGATLLTLRSELKELNGPTSWAVPVWPEPVLLILRTRAFHLRTNQSGRPVVTNGKRRKSRQTPVSPFRVFLKLVVVKW